MAVFTRTGGSLGSIGRAGGSLGFSRSFVGTGGTAVSFGWIPNPQVIANAFFDAAARVQDRRMPLTVASQITRSDIAERFRTKTDPSGTDWQDWAREYPHGPQSKGMLQKTNALRNAAISSNATRVTNDAVFYSGGSLPFYWKFHQEGARRAAGNLEGEAAGYAKHAGVSMAQARAVIASEGGGSSLPARPFLGLSDEAAAEIALTFDDWFTGAITLFLTSTGKIGRRHSLRGASGRFEPR